MEIFLSLITALTATSVAVLSYFQWRTMELTRRAGVLDRYLQTYQRLTKALGILQAEARLSDDALPEIWKARDEARLFLADEVADYTQRIHDLALEFQQTWLLLQDTPVGDRRTELVGKKYEQLQELMKLRPHEVFRKYARLS